MQGFNMGRYIPPSAAGTTTSGNSLHKKHPLGSRASKLASHGILIVRFELPFAIWCAHCPRPTTIGQGVRFNAEKRRAGSYYTTPIWSFKIRHGACGGEIEIRTDPKNSEFVVVSGARRRDYGADPERDDSLVKSDFVIPTPRERAEQRESAFGKLEKTIADRERLESATERIGELLEAAERQWEDPYALNQRLRKAFREGRHQREREAARAEELKERLGLGIELLPETEEDARRAKLVDFGSVDVEGSAGGVDKALAKPLFGRGPDRSEKGDGVGGPARGSRRLKSEIEAARRRENLASEIVSNTRAAKDPFLDFGSREGTPKGPVRLPGLKRKRPAEEASDAPQTASGTGGTPNKVVPTTALVNYNSDSE
ncbi:CWC16 protein [Thermothelomyces heterothallicus CBS 202.75]|uniref:CWC16 protein n=1 Tax=Thermothelomyces heterothallicus CBS 202.75 TaxID=1149848 RepID=UPI0037427050